MGECECECECECESESESEGGGTRTTDPCNGVVLLPQVEKSLPGLVAMTYARLSWAAIQLD